MKKLLLVLVAATFLGLFSPPDCPAPLIWRKDEGWTYERPGVVAANSPKEQLEIGKKYQADKEYSNAVSSYRRLIHRWPTSLAAQDAQMGLAESYAGLGYYYKAFKEYQTLVVKFPNWPQFDDVLQREYEIGNLFLAGERDKQWGIKLFPSLDKAAEIFDQVVKNGPYGKIAPQAQFRIGLTREKQREYLQAVHAYEKLLERYPHNPMAEDAQFQLGYAYKSEAARAEYDQNAANQSIAAFDDFIVRFPQSDKVPIAELYLTSLKQEQAKGLYIVGEFYEKRRKYRAALIYYNEVIAENPDSNWAAAAQGKVAQLTPQAPPAPRPAHPQPTTAQP